MADTMNRFAPRDADNKDGALYREFTVSLERREDGDTDERLRVAISSEAPVERYDWWKDERYVEVLDHAPGGVDLTYARDGLPFCLDHSLRSQIGLLEDLTVDADRVIRGRLRQGNHPDAAWVYADMAAGIRQKVSIGYWPGETYEQTKNADGAPPTRRYKGWMLYEASSVVVPADYTVGVGRSAGGRVATQEQIPAAAAHKAHKTEQRMEEGHALVPGTPAAPDTRAAELAVIARESGMSARLADWMIDNTSVAEARAEAFKALRASAPAPLNVSAPAVVVGHDRAVDKPWEGQEFFRSVITAARQPDLTDVRLRSQNTQIGTEGGFAVPAAVVTMLFETQKSGGEILSRVTQRPITVGNTVKESLVKEEARTNGSRNGGLRAYWVAQEGTIGESQAKLRELELNVKKVAAAIPVTEEQMEDGPQLISFLQEQVPDEMVFVKELAIWGGTGSGMPLGFSTSGALITQAIEGTQSIANTSEFIWKNAAKMMTRMNPSAFLRSAFFINPSLWADVVTSTAGAAANGATTLFTPPGRLEAAPFGAIYGRPIVPVEYASAVGVVGDFVLADLSDYLFAQKGGMKFAQSMHVEFLKDKQTLRFIERVDGQPRTRVPMTPLNGSVTVSPYVALATRS
jgi:HK97 family phage major capsid protein